MIETTLVEGKKDKVEREVNELLDKGFELVGDLQLTTRNVGNDDTAQAKMIMPWYSQSMVKNIEAPKKNLHYLIVIGSDMEGDDIEKNRQDYVGKGYEPFGNLSKPVVINAGINPDDSEAKKLINSYAQALIRETDN